MHRASLAAIVAGDAPARLGARHVDSYTGVDGNLFIDDVTIDTTAARPAAPHPREIHRGWRRH